MRRLVSQFPAVDREYRLIVLASGPDVDAAAVSQLEAMGFPTIRCQKALLATGNNGAEIAMGWLFEHMEDPGMYISSSLFRVIKQSAGDSILCQGLLSLTDHIVTI